MTCTQLSVLALVGVVALGACTTEAAEPDTQEPCPTLRVDQRTADFLDSWTEARRVRAEACVLPGRPAPAPSFDTDELGEEQRLHPDRLPQDEDVVPQDFPGPQLADGYPIVHIGQVGDTDTHLFIAWRRTPTSPVACIGSIAAQCEQSAEVAREPGVRSSGRGSTRAMTFDIHAPPGTSVVSLTVEGRPEGWQRPVALIAQITADLTWAGPDDFARFSRVGVDVEVTFLDTQGQVIGQDVLTATW